MNAKIRFYALFEFVAGTKQPKYIITKQAGFYEPIETLKGKDGKVSMYLLEKVSNKDNAPETRLQAKNSLNFTGLKWLYNSGKISGFAYGEPLQGKTYAKGAKQNPFFNYQSDGFLFVFHTATNNPVPTKFELIVLANAKPLIQSYCKQLELGGFEEDLNAIKKML